MSYDATRLEDGLNHIRFLVGDTDTTREQLTDDEITSLLALNGDDRMTAAAAAADAIAAKFAAFGAPAEEADRYKELAATLRQRQGAGYL